MASFPNHDALTYDDVLLRPELSHHLPREVELTSRFSRQVPLNIPLVSAAMDTVTEAASAICMAQQGGLGVIHKNMSIEEQARQVGQVKRYESGMIAAPITTGPDAPLDEVARLSAKHKITGLPVVDESGRCVGIVTGRDMRARTGGSQRVREVMTPLERLVVAPEGITTEAARELLDTHRIEKLPVVDEQGLLKGLITIKDILKTVDFPDTNKDSRGRLRVAAALGAGEGELERAAALLAAGTDALVLDTAHGHSEGVGRMVGQIKAEFPDASLVAGNVASAEGCRYLVQAGADGIKVGMGPGSICTTRVIAGVGMPQMSAILECAPICQEAGIPLIADGGIKYSGDVVKALAGGADSVMVGSLFAGTDEAPGEMVRYQGRSYKVYRGMGSLGAMGLGSKGRYGQEDVAEEDKLVPEGVEGQVPYRGSLAANIYQMLGGVRSGMGYAGARDLAQLRKKARFVRVSAASLREGHPHDIFVTKEAPNYSMRT